MKKTLGLLLVALVIASSIVVVGNVSGLDTQENIWVDRAPLQVARNNLGVVALNGKIYAIGGDTISGFWTYSMGLQNPKTGGIVGYVEEYDPATNTWKFKAQMPTPRAGFAIASLHDKIYCIGGNSQLNEVYNPATDTWENKKPIPTSITDIPASVIEGKIYIIDYSGTNYVYDPVTDNWEIKAHSPTPSAAGFMGHVSAVIDGKVHIISGLSGSSDSNLHQIYNPTDDKWNHASVPSNSIGNAFANGAAEATTGRLAPKRMFVFGPRGNLRQGEPDGTNRIYDSQKDSWTFGANLPSYRINFGTAVLNDTLFVIGGGIADDWFVGTLSPTPANEQYIPIGYGTPDPDYILRNTAPEIKVLSPLNGVHNKSSVPLNFTIDKTVNWTIYSFDGRENITVQGNITMTNLSNGLHNITVYAQDTYGNIGSSNTINFTVDKPDPGSFSVVSPFVAVSVAVALAAAGLLVYHKKHKHNK